MLRKLASYPRQNGLAWALREVGRVEKTLFTLEWLQSLELRRRVQVGLNKGEARNALARAVFFYRQGRVQDRSHAQQQQRAQGLNLVVAAIILWNTLELARAIEELRSEGLEMTSEQLRHLSPMDWEHIGLTGDYTWDFTAKSSRA
jgi:TnpA family transposase